MTTMSTVRISHNILEELSDVENVELLEFLAPSICYSSFSSLVRWAQHDEPIYGNTMNLPFSPITKHITPEIMNRAQPIIISAPTGSGKSTVIPLYFAKQSAKLGYGCKVMVIMPTRANTSSVAMYMANVIGERCGRTIGYAIKGEKVLSDSTSVLFVTTGMAEIILNMEPRITAIVFDEFHHRDIAVNTVLHAVKKANMWLFFCSATFPRDIGQQLESYLQRNTTEIFIDDEARKYSIQILEFSLLLEEHSLNFQTLDRVAEESKTLMNNTPILVEQQAEIKNNGFGDIMLAIHVIQKIVYSECNGNILVFVSGMQDINLLFNHDIIQDLGKRRLINYHRLHSSLDWDYNITKKNGIRKVIFATNVAETELTLPDITFVIDNFSQKRPEIYDPHGLLSVKSRGLDCPSLKQRMGRTGCQRDGYYIPLCGCKLADSFSDFWHISTATLQDPSMNILQVIKRKEEADTPMCYFDKIPEISYKGAISALMDLGCLNQHLELTQLGQLVAEFNGLSPEIAILVIAGCAFGCAKYSIVLAAILSTPSSIFAYKRDNQESQNSGFHAFKVDSSISDHVALVEGFFNGIAALRRFDEEKIRKAVNTAERKAFNKMFSAPMLKKASHNVGRIALSLSKIGAIKIGDDWNGFSEISLNAISSDVYHWAFNNGNNEEAYYGAFKASILCAFGQRVLSKNVNTYHHVGTDEAFYDDLRPVAVFYRAFEYVDEVKSAPLTPATVALYVLFSKLFGNTVFHCNTGTMEFGKISKIATEIKFGSSVPMMRFIFNARETLKNYVLSAFSQKNNDDTKQEFHRSLLRIFNDPNIYQ